MYTYVDLFNGLHDCTRERGLGNLRFHLTLLYIFLVSYLKLIAGHLTMLILEASFDELSWVREREGASFSIVSAMSKIQIAVALLACLTLSRISQCVLLQGLDISALDRSNSAGTNFIDIGATHSLTTPQRYQVRKLRKEILELEKRSAELGLHGQKTSDSLSERRKQYEHAQSRVVFFRECSERRSHLNDLCKSESYFRRHIQKCNERRSCGHGGKLIRNRRDKLRLVEKGELKLSNTRAEYKALQREEEELREKLALVLSGRKPKPSNKPRMPVEGPEW